MRFSAVKFSNLAICLTLCSACSTATLPKTYTSISPTLRSVDHYHETVGVIEAYKKLNTQGPVKSVVKPLCFSVLSPIHPSPRIESRPYINELFTKKKNAPCHLKFYLPMSLKGTLHKLHQNGALVLEIFSHPSQFVGQCRNIMIKEGSDISKGLIELKAHIQELQLSPAQSVYVRVPLGKTKQFELPKRAIHKSFFGTFVYLVNSNGNLEKRYVQLGKETKGAYLIKEGLKNTDRIAIPK